MPPFRSLAVACATLALTGCLTVTSAGALDPRWSDPGPRWSNPDPRSGFDLQVGGGRFDDGPRMVVDRWGRPVRDQFGRPVYVDRYDRRIPTDPFGRPEPRSEFGGMPGFPGFPGTGRNDGGSLRDRLSKGQNYALDQGCMDRYGGDSKKLRRCLNGDPRVAGRALEEGCYLRYEGNDEKLGRCLRQSRRGAW